MRRHHGANEDGGACAPEMDARAPAALIFTFDWGEGLGKYFTRAQARARPLYPSNALVLALAPGAGA
jgi:aldehyde:ferredoxin oxidoreductase